MVSSTVRARLAKIGSSRGVRIPKPLLEQIGALAQRRILAALAELFAP